MAPSSNLFKVFNFIFPFADFTYILQQEEYSSRRLLKWLPSFFWRRNFQIRDHLKYTQHARLIILSSGMVWLFSFIIVALILKNPLFILVQTVVWILFIPIFVLMGNIIINPYFDWIKSKIRSEAASKVSNLPGLKVIAVAGSYGKTTTKNFIQQLVQYNYRTQMIPGNINTPAGIAVWLKTNLQPTTELLIMEVDAYEIGEIARSCQLAPADIAILTNVGDQHLERFGSKRNLAKALSEVFTYSKPQANLICDLETWKELDLDNDYKKIHEIINDGFNYQGQELPIPDLSESNIINLKFALSVAEILNIPFKFVEDSITKLQLPERRQAQTQMYGYSAIDDSYNISFTTAQAGIAAASAAADKEHKKLLVITAGIPELGKQDQDKNIKLGELLNQHADYVIVLGSIFASEIAQGIAEKDKYTIVPTLNTFITTSRNDFPADQWFLLVQPELNDLYY